MTGPAGNPVAAGFALLDRTAVVEMALASGLAALPVDEDGAPVLDAGGATSRGTGELVRAALDAGATRVVLGVGGSACTDGGAGLLQALGARLLDAAAEGDATALGKLGYGATGRRETHGLVRLARLAATPADAASVLLGRLFGRVATRCRRLTRGGAGRSVPTFVCVCAPTRRCAATHARRRSSI